MREALRRAAERVRRDDGASSIELVLYTPVLMLVIFLTIQFALTWYGNEVAGAVARETARVVRVGGGTPQSVADARTHARNYTAAVGGTSFRDLQVQITQPDDQTVRVTVSGRALEIVDGFAPRVSATVQGPIEQFRPDA
ncbi:TadE family protein [Cellulomonas xylanilytica]|uniref:TadE-like domain-containing protein n=1 Tax=Cellulomonas xylanilytica TaxID=233583 RepID=A0A510V7S3_9CELL|nr:TadE family protein [Cellulomonas xylanilytica]GEK22904.1 hypothetical protein CXY01_34240 [Cellulomonas xylanilytica]